MNKKETQPLSDNRQRTISKLTELRGKTSLRAFGREIGKDSSYLARVEAGHQDASVDLIRGYANHGCKDPEEANEMTFYVCLLQGKRIPELDPNEVDAMVAFRYYLRSRRALAKTSS